jgi:hypothetical protein
MGLVWFGLICVDRNEKEFGAIYKGHEVDTFYSVVVWAPERVKRKQRLKGIYIYLFYFFIYFGNCGNARLGFIADFLFLFYF